QQELEREVRRSERHGLSLSCCFLDLDDFKLVNDRYGHLYGSAVLAKVAAAFVSAVRSKDTVGRYGGDEFVAILPETDGAAAVKLAERARQTISGLTMDREHGPVAASIGVAQWQPGFSGRDLLGAADRALGEAKGAGGA